MKDNILYIAVVMAITAMLLYTVDYERKIEILQDELDNKEILIDSLFHEIDTLTWEQEIWDFNISKNRTHLLSAIIHKICAQCECPTHHTTPISDLVVHATCTFFNYLTQSCDCQ